MKYQYRQSCYSRIKRMICMLAFAAVFSGMLMNTPVLAAAEAEQTKGSISLGCPAEGLEFSLYRVADYKDTGGFALTEKFQNYRVSLESDEWRGTARTLADYAERDGIQADAVLKSGSDKTVCFENLSNGLYLVKGQEIEAQDNGKGGIGKSTVTSNLAAAFASMGKKVIQIGCDPKADSTINLLGGEPLRPVMNYMREEDEEPEKLEDISREGFGGVLCIETGGPTPGLGCAGRGIIATFQLLEDLRLFETYQPDVVLYDVLGDVVCGGFAAPIREGYAEKVLIVTSGEKMALYAANNISSAVRNFEDRSYARVFGIVLNHRNVENETEKVQAFADKSGIPIVGEIPRSDEIIRWEDQGKTVIEGDAKSSISRRFFDLAEMLLKAEEEE